MEIGVKLSATFKNNAFYQARLNKGYESLVDFVKDFSSIYGETAYGSVNAWENMKATPCLETQLNLSKFLDVPKEILFPSDIKKSAKGLKKLNKKIYLISKAEKLISGQREEEREFLLNDLRDSLNNALNTLDKRERKILELRFYDGKTLKEVGDELKITSPERVRQIESKALIKLRHPVRRKIIEEGTLEDDIRKGK